MVNILCLFLLVVVEVANPSVRDFVRVENLKTLEI